MKHKDAAILLGGILIDFFKENEREQQRKKNYIAALDAELAAGAISHSDYQTKINEIASDEQTNNIR